MNKLFYDFSQTLLDNEASIKPNIYNIDEKSVMVEYPLIGIDKKDINLTISEDIIKVKVEATNIETEYISKGFNILNNIEKELKVNTKKFDVEKITSEMKNGILYITIPIKEGYVKNIEIK